ncbi:MAG: spore coat protein U domain-containing protein [Candidatus Deferrimicrobiaceae bacterium]
MKKSIMVFIMMLPVLAAGGVAWAVDTTTLTVSASVTETCKFSSATSTLNFGVLDPSTPVVTNGSTSTRTWCTKGVTTDTVSANNGANYSGASRRMAGPGGDFIPYSLTLTPDSNPNAGPATPRTLAIGGTVRAADYTGVGAGSYSDTVTLSINP